MRAARITIAGCVTAATLCAASIPVPSPMLAASTLVLKGTDIGDVPTDAQYLGFVASFVNGVQAANPPVAPTPSDIVDYPASFRPFSKGGFSDPTWNSSVATGTANLAADVAAAPDGDVLIFGYSQGAVVASEYKAANPTPAKTITYVLVSNPNRPNGGILERFAGITIPLLDVTANGATPPQGGITYDIARQYEGWTDFPRYPLNLLSTLNAVVGIIYLHGVKKQLAEVDFADLDDPTKTDIIQDGDSTYYTIPTTRLPILRPFEIVVPSPLLTALDAPLRVMVEWGYDRQTSPGTPTSGSLIRIANPIRDAANLLRAIPTGIDDGLAEAAGDPNYRPLGTTPAGMYGVGGRPLSSLSQAPNTTAATPTRTTESSRASTAASTGAATKPSSGAEPTARATPKPRKSHTGTSAKRAARAS